MVEYFVFRSLVLSEQLLQLAVEFLCFSFEYLVLFLQVKLLLLFFIVFRDVLDFDALAEIEKEDIIEKPVHLFIWLAQVFE